MQHHHQETSRSLLGALLEGRKGVTSSFQPQGSLKLGGGGKEEGQHRGKDVTVANPRHPHKDNGVVDTHQRQHGLRVKLSSPQRRPGTQKGKQTSSGLEKDRMQSILWPPRISRGNRSGRAGERCDCVGIRCWKEEEDGTREPWGRHSEGTEPTHLHPLEDPKTWPLKRGTAWRAVDALGGTLPPCR